MARAVNRLSARAVATLTKPGYHPDGAGLYLQVTAAGAKSWIYRYTIAGRAREMGLGGLLTVSLAEARQTAHKARQALLAGLDPISERDAQRLARAGVPKFSTTAAEYIAAHSPGWRNDKHAAQWTSTLNTYASPVIGERPVDQISTDDILRILSPIWTEKTETATRVRQRIEQVIDWSTAKKLRTGENPARWRGHLDKLLPKPTKVRKVQHFAAMPYDQLPAFMADLAQRKGTAARALEFTILTASRTSMTIGAAASEDDGDLWRIPAARMKADREHLVPIVPRVRTLLDALPKSAYLFAGSDRPQLSSAAMDALMKRMKRSEYTVHGFRSSFKDWAAEKTNHPNIVSEAALSHSIGDKAEAAYRRGHLLEKRRELMQEWADYLYPAGRLKKKATAAPPAKPPGRRFP